MTELSVRDRNKEPQEDQRSNVTRTKKTEVKGSIGHGRKRQEEDAGRNNSSSDLCVISSPKQLSFLQSPSYHPSLVVGGGRGEGLRSRIPPTSQTSPRKTGVLTFPSSSVTSLSILAHLVYHQPVTSIHLPYPTYSTTTLFLPIISPVLSLLHPLSPCICKQYTVLPSLTQSRLFCLHLSPGASIPYLFHCYPHSIVSPCPSGFPYPLTENSILHLFFYPRPVTFSFHP